MRIARGAAMALALLALPARADITLPGYQHIGDGDNTGYTPRDPVTRAQMQANPTYFHLSQAVTVTAVRLENPNDLDATLRVFIDDMNTPLAGTLSGSTYTLTSPVTLAAGVHTIWPDGGCSVGGFAMPCTGGENDFGFSAITLVSSQTNFSRSFHQRRHLGDTDDNSDDNYGGRWYPDRADATTLSHSFTLESARVLTETRFRRVRDVAASPDQYASVIIDDGTAGEVTIGTVTTNGSLVTISSSVTLAAGAHTITIAAGIASGTDHDDISWDDLVLLFTPVAGTSVGAFNAVETGAIDVATGQIPTKTAGTGFTLDLVALSGGALQPAYTGTVSVELVDASGATGSCTSWPAAASLGTATFTALDAGRLPFAFTYANALAHARVRINDAANAVTACSYDNFAIKPAGFDGITLSHDDAATPGTAVTLATSGFTASTTPVHKAGRYFTVQAYAHNSSGAVTTAYAGSPDLRESATIAGMGAVLGGASASGWTHPLQGYVRSDAAQYTEAGAAMLELVDTTFAAVDADDTPDADRYVGPTAFGAGRFVPDHFTFTAVVPAQLEAECGTFTYVGQPFNFGSTPSARITAMSSGGTATRNYTDPGLYKISVAAQSTYTIASGTFDATAIPNPDNTFVNEGDGKSLYTLIPPNPGYRFTRGAPEPQFDAEITIALNFTESDGVAFAAATPGSFGDPLAGGIPFTGGNQIRYGRLVVGNAQGSELLPLAVPLQTEYVLASGSGFARNLADSCSLVPAGDIVLGPSALVGLPDPPGDTAIDSITGGMGLWQLKLTAPGDAGQVPVTANITASFPWLLTDDADGDTTYDDNPSGIATFGLAGGDDRRIFTREIVGY